MSAPADDIVAALRLINTPMVGAVTFYRLVQEHGSIQRAVVHLEQYGKHKPWSKQQALAEFENAAKLGIHILLYTDEAYPAALKDFPAAPPILYAKGNLEALQYNKALAVVGSRAASINGRKAAAHIAKDLTEAGVCIISGMARGIDAAAHKGAMFANNETGTTIAVVGTGLDIVYPAENTDLSQKIEQNGCIISELPLGSMPVAKQFPQRNRIVAALSEGVLVVEAGLKSGSLITAQFAAEQKKLIFAVPGTPGESRTQGANFLIKQGAVLVESAQDILPFLKGNKQPKKIQKITVEQKNLVFENNDVNLSEQENSTPSLADFLTVDGVAIDELIRLSGKDAAVIAMEILELEIAGLAERRAGNKVALIDQTSGEKI